jgi:hypothetical protein
MAPRDFTPGSESSASVVSAIDECKILVLILSSRADSSHQVVSEVARATASHKLIACLRVEDFRPTGELLSAIGCLHWLDAVRVPVAEAAKRLAQEIQQTIDLQASAAPRAAPVVRTSEGAPSKPIDIQREGQSRRPNYDVFISYRRERDAQTARLIRAELRRRRFRVFLDVDDLRPGHFDEALLERIQEAANFVLILSPSSLDRCANPDDWFRREIVCALAERKTLIPIMMPGFSFPKAEELPDELRPIRVHQGVNYSHDFFDAMIEKLVGYLGTPQAS